MLTLRQQLDDARDQVFHIDLDVYRDNVAGASTHAMKLTGELSADRQAQCESNFEAICRAAPDAMPNAVERLLQAHYMVAAAENDPNNPAKLLPLMTLSWVIGMAVGLVRDVDVLAAQKKRKDHAAAGAGGGKSKGAAMRPLYVWVHENKDRFKGVPSTRAGHMAPHVPEDVLPPWMCGPDASAPVRAIKEFLLDAEDVQKYKMHGGVKPASKPKTPRP